MSDPDDDYQSPLNSFIQKNSIFLNPTNPEEIIEITNKLKSSNSSGMDNISSKLLPTIFNEIAPSFHISSTGHWLQVKSLPY